MKNPYKPDELAKKIVGDFLWTEPTYYTSLFKSCAIGEYFLRDHLGLISTVGNDLVFKRTKWSKELEPECEIVCGDIWDKDVFEKLVRLHKEKGNTGVMCSCACQSYSLANSKRNPSDKRGLLFEPSLEFVRRTDPDWVLFENVPQMLKVKLNDGRIVGEYIVKELKNMGYNVVYGIQNAANFYVPQNRFRAIILARKSRVWNFPTPNLDKIYTLEMAIGDLPSIEAGEISNIKNHYAPMWAKPQIEVMKHTPTGCSAHDNPAPWTPVNADGSPSKAKFHCSFQRKSWDSPCNTILCDSKGVSGFRNVHPGRLLSNGCYSDARCLSILEIMRCSSVPDTYPIPDWASDKLIREAFGESFAPLHVLAIMKMLFV
ncbi:MAG: DNA cytosine methyltransferase [Alphaproteobacteria bacterium]|nr:DNA cytosine methyltransferase [Alphaproteobacteria bacterium]